MWALQHLAAIAVLSAGGSDAEASKRQIAARLLGYVDANSAALCMSRQYAERQEYERVFAALRCAIGAEEASKLLAEGTALTEDQAIACAAD